MTEVTAFEARVRPPEQETRFNAAWLMQQTFPPLQYVVDGIIPEGMTLVVAAPKVGKSWLSLDIGVGVSSGRRVLGAIGTGRARPVLYLALEDGPRRLRDRMEKIDATQPSQRFEFITRINKETLLEEIHAWVKRYADEKPLVILDTLGKVMPPAVAGENDYQRDYRVGGVLKGIVDEFPGSAILIVHHTRKADSDDFLETVSGTNGLAGAADTIVVLRRKRGSDEGSIHVTSRDAAEGEYAAAFTELRWILEGDSLAEARDALQSRRDTSGLGGDMAEIVEAVKDYPDGVDAKTLAEAVELDYDKVRRYLSRAVDSGRILRLGRGKYSPKPPVTSVPSVPTVESDDHQMGQRDTWDTLPQGVGDDR